MQNKLFRKGLVFGVIFLFIGSTYIPVIKAETNSINSDSIKSKFCNSSKNNNDKFNVFYYVRVRGFIKDLKVIEEPVAYYFKTINVVFTAFVVVFIGIIPVTQYERYISKNEECDFDFLYPGNIYSRHFVTENYIDFIAIYFGPFYYPPSPPLYNVQDNKI